MCQYIIVKNIINYQHENAKFNQSECPELSPDFFYEAQNLQQLSINYITTSPGEPPIVARRPDFSSIKSLDYRVNDLYSQYFETMLQHTKQRLTSLSLSWECSLDTQTETKWCTVEKITQYCPNLETLSLRSPHQDTV